MIDMEYKESLQKSLARLESLSADKLAQFIFDNNPPPVGWCMDVYIADGELYTSDYYSTGTIIQYEPDVFVVISLNNSQGELDPTEAYDVGTSWDLSDEFVEKYFENYLKDFNTNSHAINIEKMQKYIWEECMTEEEKEEEIQKMTEFYWLGDYDTQNWLQVFLEGTIKEIKQELGEIEKEEGYEY